ncbi:MAG: polysaccharide deacetylase family protein [Elusimicrobiota bacterium]
MNYLKENFEVITVSKYLQKIEHNQLAGNEVCITFDDGFKDNYIYAFPILQKYGLKATFFLTTKYIGNDTIFPWILLDKGAKDDIVCNRKRWLPLSWEEVKEMVEYGMEFGTHTHTHRDSLSNMSVEEVENEIGESTQNFKEKTGFYPELFSYPHGTFKDYDKAHIELLKSYNYRAALTTNAGRNSTSQNPYEIKRIIIYEEDSLWEFKKKVNGAYDIAEPLQKIWLNIAGTKKYKNYT